MAAFWLERRRRQEQADRDFEHARSRRLLLPLEETSPGVGLDADIDHAGSTPPADLPRFGDVSSNDTTAVERVSVATTDGVAGARSTSGECAA